MPTQAPINWLQRYGGSPDTTPTFIAYNWDDSANYGTAIRQAFAFFRKHGDRRYSPTSLMKLLAYADRFDQAREGEMTVHADDLPTIVVCELPYHYNEDTEVKSGGTLAVAALLPDGRLMLAVHNEKRRAKLGTAMLQFVRNYVNGESQVWVHRNNFTGAIFLASLEFKPWAINTSGAVQYAMSEPFTDDSGAVASADDSVVDALLRQQQRSTARRQPRVRSPRVALDTLSDICRGDGIEAAPLAAYQWEVLEDDEEEEGVCDDEGCDCDFSPRARRQRDRAHNATNNNAIFANGRN